MSAFDPKQSFTSALLVIFRLWNVNSSRFAIINQLMQTEVTRSANRIKVMLLRQIQATVQDGEVVMKSTSVMVALAAITLSSLALIQSAEARRYRSYCGYPDYGYLAPYPLGGNHTPRVSFVPVVVTCADHPYVVWKHCNVNSCW